MCIRDRYIIAPSSKQDYTHLKGSQCLGKSSYNLAIYPHKGDWQLGEAYNCLLYTSDAADERSSVDLGGRRIIKKKTKTRKFPIHFA